MRIALTVETDVGVYTVSSQDSSDVVSCGPPDRELGTEPGAQSRDRDFDSARGQFSN